MTITHFHLLWKHIYFMTFKNCFLYEKLLINCFMIYLLYLLQALSWLKFETDPWKRIFLTTLAIYLYTISMKDVFLKMSKSSISKCYLIIFLVYLRYIVFHIHSYVDSSNDILQKLSFQYLGKSYFYLNIFSSLKCCF